MARALVCVLGLVSGCSFITVRGAPDPIPTERPVQCTESRIPPALDTVPAVVLLGGGSLLIGEAFSQRGGGQDSPAAILFVTGVAAVLAGLPFAGSAWYGYVKTGRCRDLNRPPPPTLGGLAPQATGSR